MAIQKNRTRLPKVARAATFALIVLMASAVSVRTVPAAQRGQASPDGKTKVNVGVTELTDNVSFEVPLYYVMCVTNDETNNVVVRQPDDGQYRIVNTSKGTQDVAVTEIVVNGVAGGSWELTDQASLGTSPTDRKISMTVGEIPLPAVAAGDTNANAAVETGKSDNVFYRNGAYTRLSPYDKAHPENSTVLIPVSAEVSSAYKVQADVKSAAQFKLCYTVSPLNKNGDLMKAYYNGPEKTLHN